MFCAKASLPHSTGVGNGLGSQPWAPLGTLDEWSKFNYLNLHKVWPRSNPRCIKNLDHKRKDEISYRLLSNFCAFTEDLPSLGTFNTSQAKLAKRTIASAIAAIHALAKHLFKGCVIYLSAPGSHGAFEPPVTSLGAGLITGYVHTNHTLHLSNVERETYIHVYTHAHTHTQSWAVFSTWL